jgi:hypothetical protein
MNISKLQWIGKLLRTKNYVVLTDRSAVIRIAPTDRSNVLLLASQQAQLVLYHEKLGELIGQYSKMIDRSTSIAVRQAKSGAQKIKVNVKKK